MELDSTRLTRRDAALLAGLLLLALLAGLLKLQRRPDLVFDEYYLISDHGMNLLVADDLLAGRRLYRDIYYQYGPLPIYLYTGVAALFGNAPETYVGFQLAFNLVHLLLLALLLRSVTSRATTMLVLFGAVSVMLFPVALFGGYTGAAYMPLERCWFTAVVLTWTPPARRSMQRYLVLGGLLGSWQFLKFGGAFFCGAAIILLDLLALFTTTPAARDWRRWLYGSILTLLVFLAFEAALVLLALFLLPRAVALDLIWPQYFLAHYSAVVAERWPLWWGWYFFAAGQWPALLAALLALIGFGVLLWKSGQQRARGEETIPDNSVRLFLPLVFFLVAAAGRYLAHEHMFYFNMWMLFIPAAWLVDRLGVLGKFEVGLLWAPTYILLLLVGYWHGIPERCSREVFPNGQALYCTEKSRQVLDVVRAALEEPGRDKQDCLIFIPMGAGLHHFFDIPHATRNVWLLPGLFRPYDEEALLAGLSRTSGVIVFNEWHPLSDADPLAWAAELFSPATCAALRERLEAPRKLRSKCWLFPVKPAGPGAEE